jgi:hypothetical protein
VQCVLEYYDEVQLSFYLISIVSSRTDIENDIGQPILIMSCSYDIPGSGATVSSGFDSDSDSSISDRSPDESSKSITKSTSDVCVPLSETTSCEEGTIGNPMSE